MLHASSPSQKSFALFLSYVKNETDAIKDHSKASSIGNDDDTTTKYPTEKRDVVQ
jgi:hypothetical protein